MTNSTVSGNSAAVGGGIYSTGHTRRSYHVTIARNTATSGGGMTCRTHGDELDRRDAVRATIRGARARAASVPPARRFQRQHNVADVTPPGAGNRVAWPKRCIAPLANYGGPTRTHALYTGSPAIDAVPAVNCQAHDQRALPRRAPCDVGAFEGSIAPPSRHRRHRHHRHQNEELPPPVAGKTVNALPARGHGEDPAAGHEPLREAHGGSSRSRSGRSIDTRKGRVTLVAASNKSGGTATATFYDGLFRLGQTRGAQADHDVDVGREAPLPRSRARRARRRRGRRSGGCGVTARAGSGPRASTARRRCAARSGSCRTRARARSRGS